MSKFNKFIPLDKSWLTRVGVLDIINGYADIERFISDQKDINDDILAIRNASIAWRKNQKINVGESATLYRLLQFASWKLKLNKVFIKEGSLKDRKITDDPNIVNFNQTKLLNLDNGTTQWATATVICGDRERLDNPPQKLKETYDAVLHWETQRKKGLCWEPKYDQTIKRQKSSDFSNNINKASQKDRKLSDKKIINLISDEIKKELNTISLIPSENVMSRLATSAYTLRSNNRYVIKSKIGSRYFMPGRENLGKIITILEDKLCSIYDVEFSITKGFSGIHNMDVVMSAIGKIIKKIVILNIQSGGHSKTRGVALKNGFEVETLNLDFDTWDLDYKDFGRIIEKWEKEKVFIYLDHTVSVNPLNIEKLTRKIPKSWIVYYDISHLQLFYFTRVFKFPKSQNFFFGGSTHKTFPGPQ